ncbi:MAG: methylaspartate ammonia-lyase [Defluviitaleaceae bacterium]|nr:methylaspartate ammonia-lyase [Defluviitaleaceae bacterium]MCL2273592.1 methylaspartate ammonia-lyase [Defluviitaleaceae bacterium]
MKIVDIVCSAGRTGFFFDDQAAIKTTAIPDGNAYLGDPVTAGFTKVRQAGESVSVMFVLEDGQIAHGDCAAVQYSGTGGRDPLFLAEDFIPLIRLECEALYKGKEITTFKEMAHAIDSKRPCHTAIRYGVTQACLDAAAKSQKKLMAQVIAEEYGLQMATARIPIFSQSGDDRYTNVDKMILKGSEVLPHGLINNMSKLGYKGEKLLEYIAWLRDRIINIAPHDAYKPALHIDVYGVLGIALDHSFPAIVDFMGRAGEIAAPYLLRIEGPVDMGNREAQVEALASLTASIEKAGIPVEIVADEWCNTYEDIKIFTNNKAGHMAQIKTPDLGGINNSIEAVLYCKQNGMGAYLGGTCNETDRSGQICTHIAMATSPVQLLAKPGMGVDEGYMNVYNEMGRILALAKRGGTCAN